MTKTLPNIPIPNEVTQNLAMMFERNVQLFADKFIFCQRDKTNEYQGITWKSFYEDILNIAWNLKQAGIRKGTKVILYCPNSLNMLKAEMAIMASGAIAVPIFAYFKKNTSELLINHSDAEYIILAGPFQFNELSNNLPKIKTIWTFESLNNDTKYELRNFSDLLSQRNEQDYKLDTQAYGKEICLNMYTSGTTGVPKCVQLTHENILSQQASIHTILNVTSEDRFLSYLPWHHSFGGIFELFSALYNGATYHLESSFGKDVHTIFENWKNVHPTVFFSVPKVYQSLFELANASKEAEEAFFNSGLKFIFTAAAALPQRLSDEFEKRGINVIEGWGLTETSPCCTLTDPKLKREAGVVGMPIPGVKIRIAEDDEIQVNGPNVMVGYYKNDEANEGAFTEDGWYRTGDVGEVTENGLKLISRKDRIFKLSNGEKVIPTDLEKAIELKCHYVQYAVVAGSGEEYPVALIFPNKKLLNQPDYAISPEQGCFCPRNINEMGHCLTGCLQLANQSIGQKFAKIKSAAIIDDELSLDNNMLTPSMKVAPKNVIEKYKTHLQNLYGDNVPTDEEVYIIELEPNNNFKRCM
ncbi:MAG: AMP-binding protein [Bacteroidetes bacterium]|nr:AMP-binding protein [Bacteroidota bacterium]